MIAPYRSELHVQCTRIVTNACRDPIARPREAGAAIRRPSAANGQLAKINEVAAFVVRVADTGDGYGRWPEYPTSPELVRSVFERRGPPARFVD